MIVPFINVRGWNIVYPYESLSVAIQNGIQDIYNEYKWSWLNTSTRINTTDWIDSNWYYTYEVGKNKFVSDLITYDASWNIEAVLTEVKRITELTENTFMAVGDYVLVNQPVVVTINYMRDFEWTLFDKDTSRDLPLPDKMIPALYYLVLSQIDIIEVTQAESQTYSNYGKYTNKIKTLKENDLWIASSIAGWNRS